MPTFIELLPKDIHDRIAHYLYSSTRYPKNHFCEDCIIDAVADDNRLDTLLNYAKSGPAQCRAIAKAMSERLYITDDWRSERIVDWISTLANYLEILDMSEAPIFYVFSSPPKLPKLKRAVINTRRDELYLIQGSPNLRQLKVFICDTYDWDMFVSTVGSLHLQELQLVFIHDDTMKRLSRAELMNLAEVCPMVESLYLDVVISYLPQKALSMVQGMPSLKQLRWKGYLQEHDIPFVETLEELGLEKVHEIGRATRFGPAVTYLSLERPCEEDMIRIRFLPNLRKLVIKLKYKHERGLVGVIDNVEELYLSWDSSGCLHSVQGPLGPRTEIHPFYYEPNGEVLEEIVRSAKRLKSLHIEKAIVSSDVVIRLLEIAGGRLEKFEICHDWQKEPAPDRMERILKGVAQNCPNLKTLSFLELPHINGREPHWPIVATEEQKRRCSRALEEVAAVLPGFKSYRHVRSTILNSFTEEEPDYMTWHRMLELSGSCEDT